MLRITVEPEVGMTRLVLEGRVIGPWVNELALSCTTVRGSGRPVMLDMSSICFLDPEAVRLLRTLMSQGVSVEGCSPFVHEQLTGGFDDATRAG